MSEFQNMESRWEYFLKFHTGFQISAERELTDSVQGTFKLSKSFHGFGFEFV